MKRDTSPQKKFNIDIHRLLSPNNCLEHNKVFERSTTNGILSIHEFDTYFQLISRNRTPLKDLHKNNFHNAITHAVINKTLDNFVTPVPYVLLMVALAQTYNRQLNCSSLNTLEIGLGLGSISTSLLVTETVGSVDSVEIDPAVIDCYKHVQKFLQYNQKRNNALHIVQKDGVTHLGHGDKAYSLIMIDALGPRNLEDIPLQLFEPSQVLNRCVENQGALIINLPTRAQHVFNQTIGRLKQSCEYLLLYEVEGFENIIIVAANDEAINIKLEDIYNIDYMKNSSLTVRKITLP